MRQAEKQGAGDGQPRSGGAPADLRIRDEKSSAQAPRRDGLLAAHLGAQHVGALDFSVVGQDLQIHVLYLRPAFRRRGIAHALLAHLAARCLEKGWARLQWSVLDWNAPAIAFYKSLGSELQDEWRLCRLSGKALADLAQQGA